MLRFVCNEHQTQDIEFVYKFINVFKKAQNIFWILSIYLLFLLFFCCCFFIYFIFSWNFEVSDVLWHILKQWCSQQIMFKKFSIFISCFVYIVLLKMSKKWKKLQTNTFNIYVLNGTFSLRLRLTIVIV